MHAFDLVVIVLPVLAFAVALFLTRRIQSDDPAPVAPEHDAESVRTIWLVVGTLLGGALLLYLVLKHPRWGLGAAVAWALLWAAFHIRRLSAQRRACRGIVAGVTGTLAMLTLFCFTSMDGSPPTWVLYVGFAAAAVMVFLSFWIQGRARGTGFAPLWVIIAFLLLFRHLPDFNSPTTEDAVQFVEAFDEPTSDTSDWRDFGFVARWLRTQGVPFDTSIPRGRLRSAIITGKRVAPTTLNAASSSGLLSEADLAPFRTHPGLKHAYELAQMTVKVPGPHITDAVLLLHAMGDIEDADRYAASIDEHWPKDDDPLVLANVHAAVSAYGALGADPYIERRAPDIRRLLSKLWSNNEPGFVDRVGDEYSSSHSNVMALELIARIGIPPSIDLDQLRKHIREELSGRRGSRGFDSYVGLDLLTSLRLRADYPQSAMKRFVADYGAPLALWCLILFGAIVLLRAPSATVTLTPPSEPPTDPKSDWPPPESFETKPEPARSSSWFRTSVTTDTDPDEPNDPS